MAGYSERVQGTLWVERDQSWVSHMQDKLPTCSGLLSLNLFSVLFLAVFRDDSWRRLGKYMRCQRSNLGRLLIRQIF